jgi:hypothetical protein
LVPEEDLVRRDIENNERESRLMAAKAISRYLNFEDLADMEDT